MSLRATVDVAHTPPIQCSPVIALRISNSAAFVDYEPRIWATARVSPADHCEQTASSHSARCRARLDKPSSTRETHASTCFGCMSGIAGFTRRWRGLEGRVGRWTGRDGGSGSGL